MQLGQMHYLPLTPGFFSILVAIFVILLVLIQLGILRYAYMSLGLGPGGAMLLLIGSLIGSFFNIPVAELPQQGVLSGQVVDYYGMRYVVPVVVQSPGTVIAVNIGGGLIPTVMSLYLLARYELWLKGALATAVVAAVIHWFAEPVAGVGIAVPVFMPAVVTAIVAFLLSREYAA